MSCNIVKVDYNNWKRKEVFEFFNKMNDPFFGVCFNVDVTNAYKFAKDNNLSFYMVLTFLVTKAINNVEEFHYFLKDNCLYRMDKRIPSFTELNKDTEIFKIVTVDILDDIKEFCEYAKKEADKQDFFIDSNKEENNLIYISCLPWLDLTGFQSEGLIGCKDSIPRITWGKYKKINDRLLLNISIQVNHMYCDGLHIGKFNQELQKEIDRLLICQ